MSDKLSTILQAARDHAERVILPNVDAWSAAKKWPRDASDNAGAAGLTGLYAPEEFGGQRHIACRAKHSGPFCAAERVGQIRKAITNQS